MKARSLLAVSVAALALAMTGPAAASANRGATASAVRGVTVSDTVSDTERRTRALVAAFEHEDVAAVSAMLRDDSTFAIPLSFTGRKEDAARFTGRAEVLGYVKSAFATMGRIDFVDVKVSVIAGGKTSFVEAEGDFTTADGRPYRNVYVYRFDWRGGRMANGLEYANPITFCNTFSAPGC
ncbi:nuclear transport factor 2 family protein [Nonomuraea sp. MG754425]|uniref:nuclear transport factor 2 family protein n=1 Tax=Nonomuraea sp. MG754425 TaxID=2570319 RepID=UPI001F35E79E|nr:nuclear transport factor 2 family protein [Nonomuraea sp. MG754425]MCF6473049.1 nuclear transport factor 2 family protein [Nonomuraea sp. MG754425]